MARWTRVVLRYRWLVLGIWLVVLVSGGYASSKLTPLLSNTFTVPGTDSERARDILQHHFGDRSDGEFIIVYRVRRPAAGLRPRLERSLKRAATAVPTGEATSLRVAPGGVVYGSILTTLNLAKAKNYSARSSGCRSLRRSRSSSPPQPSPGLSGSSTSSRTT